MKTRILYPLLLLLLFCAPACGSNDGMSGGDFIPIQSGDVTLAAALDLPAGDGPHPALVMVHGSGKITRDQLAGFASHFAALGLAVLRYDKRGVGQSTGRYRGVNAANSIEVFDILAGDVLAVVAHLKEHPRIDPAQIGLIGGSQVGWIIPLAASRSSGVAFMVSVSGAVSTVGVSDFYDEIAEGLSEAEIAEALQHFDGIHGFDPVPALEALTIPGLWVYGGQDKSNPTANDIAILERIKAEHHKNYTICLFPNGDHELRDVTTGQPIAASPACIDPWLLEHVAVHPSRPSLLPGLLKALGSNHNTNHKRRYSHDFATTLP